MVISNPNIRRQVMGLFGQMDTDELVNMLSSADTGKIPKTEYEELMESLAADQEKEQLDESPFFSEEAETPTSPNSPKADNRPRYAPGYAPRQEPMQHSYLDEEPEAEDVPEEGTHVDFTPRTPKVSDIMPKPQNAKKHSYLDDDGTDGSEDYVPSSGGGVL